MYKVCIKHGFKDWDEFGGHRYKLGDEYPAAGTPEPTPEHVAYLASADNKLHEPCIQEVTPQVIVPDDDKPPVTVEPVGVITRKPAAKKAAAKKGKKPSAGAIGMTTADTE